MRRAVVEFERVYGVGLKPGYDLKLSCGHWVTRYSYAFESKGPPKTTHCAACVALDAVLEAARSND